MKWNKFKKIREDHPWIVSWVGSSQIVSVKRSNQPLRAEQMLNEWVAKRVDYISFRPFGAVSLSSEGYMFTKEIRDNEHHLLIHSTWDELRYYVLYHIDGEDKPFARSEGLHLSMDRDLKDGDSIMIHQGIGEVMRWHEEHWAKKGNALIFDAVLKVSTSGDSEHGVISQDFEIFPFPEGYGQVNL